MKDAVKDYYGKVLQGSHDLQTNACCTTTVMPAHVRQALANVHDEVKARYYGCGLVMPLLLEGLRVMDLGSGSGRDCYLLSQFVGERGHVLGVDMTAEQLAVARRHIDYHADKFGYPASNVEFREGCIEQLDRLGLPDESFDVIVSNCVLNLCQDKAAVLREAHRLLRPGGEMYFSDVYADRRIPQALAQDPVLYGECLSGALYWNDFQRLAREAGFADPRLVEDRPLDIGNDALHARIGHIRFFSATYRLFKLPELETACEDYGQAVRYRGTVPHHEDLFVLDKHHRIERGRMFPVCGNTYRMLSESRFASHFEFFGDWQTHHGIFPGCGVGMPFGSAEGGSGGGCCC